MEMILNNRTLSAQEAAQLGLVNRVVPPERTLDEALAAGPELGYPVIVRPSFTLGGTGGGIAYNLEDLQHLAAEGLEASMITEVMLEESVLGWKEYELEVMRDFADNVVIICSIENFDPMGVHTGDSITVAPAQTLSDREYQAMRDASLAIMREIGLETGGRVDLVDPECLQHVAVVQEELARWRTTLVTRWPGDATEGEAGAGEFAPAEDDVFALRLPTLLLANKAACSIMPRPTSRCWPSSRSRISLPCWSRRRAALASAISAHGSGGN